MKKRFLIEAEIDEDSEEIDYILQAIKRRANYGGRNIRLKWMKEIPDGYDYHVFIGTIVNSYYSKS